MRINWRLPPEKPADNQSCHLYIDRGMAADVIVVDIIYKESPGGWLDLFASPEAGSIYRLEDVSAWVPSQEIDLLFEDKGHDSVSIEGKQ